MTDPFEKFKFNVASPEEIELTDEIKEAIKNGTAVYAPYIPLHVTPTVLKPEPDVIEKLAATVDPELKAKHVMDEALNRDREEWLKDVVKRHGRKVKVIRPEFYEKVTVDNL